MWFLHSMVVDNVAAVVPIELYGLNNGGNKRRYACSDGAKINKGDILKLVADRTASQSLGTGDVFAGIAAMDKEAGDGSTTISAWTDGIFDITASVAVVVGQIVGTAAGGNAIIPTTSGSLALIVGNVIGNASADGLAQIRINI